VDYRFEALFDPILWLIYPLLQLMVEMAGADPF
jgi:hypothetical protein